jgi:poly-gamma-glutamate capsule biosynthesis protein CapA/YwtB (metallophosphatase superfamily)
LDTDFHRAVRKAITGCRSEGCKFTFRPATFLFVLIFSISLVACEPHPTVKLALLGDLMLSRGVDPKPASLAFLAPELAEADLALANLESPLSPSLPAVASAYNLCAYSDRANLLSAWGFDLLSIANNHSFDCGPDELNSTVKALTTAGITPIGSGAEPVYRNVNGLRLAFLAFDDITSPLDTDAAAQAIRSAHEDGAIVIVSIHWGMEYQGGASDRQKSLARRFAEAGAALVWGHHPHVLQPVAWIAPSTLLKTSPSSAMDGPLRTFVLYSLGNALFDQGGLADTRQSALVLVEVNANGVQSVRAVPFVIDVADSLLVAPDTETAENILDRIKIK